MCPLAATSPSSTPVGGGEGEGREGEGREGKGGGGNGEGQGGEREGREGEGTERGRERRGRGERGRGRRGAGKGEGSGGGREEREGRGRGQRGEGSGGRSGCCPVLLPSTLCTAQVRMLKVTHSLSVPFLIEYLLWPLAMADACSRTSSGSSVRLWRTRGDRTLITFWASSKEIANTRRATRWA